LRFFDSIELNLISLHVYKLKFMRAFAAAAIVIVVVPPLLRDVCVCVFNQGKERKGATKS